MKSYLTGLVGVVAIFSLSVEGIQSQTNENEESSVQLAMQQAEMYYNNNMLDSALMYCNRAISLGGNRCTVFDFRGIVYTKMQKYAKAIRDFKTAIALDSACYEAYNHLGIVYLCRNELDLAIECFNRSVELNPQYAKAYYNRGIARLYLQDTDEALDDMKKAANLNYSEAIKFLHQLN